MVELLLMSLCGCFALDAERSRRTAEQRDEFATPNAECYLIHPA
jgi:uncharacterized OsmC-like protein